LRRQLMLIGMLIVQPLCGLELTFTPQISSQQIM
jgi:hypothetical protein